MAVRLIWDLLSDAAIEEELGAYDRVIRKVLVTGLSPGASMAAHFQALEESGLPIVNTPLSAAHPGIRLRSRRLAGRVGSPGQVTVLLEYSKYSDMPTNTFSGGSDIQQLETSTDIFGRALTVSHTYPPEDNDFGGQTQVQGISVTADSASPYLRSTLYVEIDFPLSLVAQWINVTNLTPWGGGAARSYCCTSVEFKPHKLLRYPLRDIYIFSWTFNYKATGWDILATFKDPRTGLPPAGLVPGVGWQYISAHRAVEYRSQYPYFLA